MARSLAEADEMIAAAARRGRRAGRRAHRAVQSGGRAARPLLADPRFIEVHRLGTFPERSLDIDVVFDLMIHDLDVVLSLVQFRGRVDRGGGRAGADRPRRHRQRAAAVRERLHRQPDRQPHQPRPGAQDPLLPAGGVPVDRLRRAEGRGLAAGQEDGAMPSIEGGERRRSPTRSRSSASSPTSSTPFATRRAPAAVDRRRTAAARWTRSSQRARSPDHEDRRSTSVLCLVTSWTSSCIPTSTTSSPISTSRKLLARVAEPVSPDLEIAAVTDRACKSPGGGPALLFEKPDRLRHPGGDQRLRIDRAHVPRARRARRSTISRRRSTS